MRTISGARPVEGSSSITSRGLDIKALPSELGYFTYDPGFSATAACTSKITFIDGDKGILRYRGYPIEQLAERSTFVEVAYLIIYGKLPNQKELDAFADALNHHAMLHEDMKSFYNGFPRDAHPMAILSSMINTLWCYNEDVMEMEDEGKMTVQILGSEALYPEHLEMDCRDANGDRVEIDS